MVVDIQTNFKVNQNKGPEFFNTGNGASMVERTNEQQRVLEKRRADLAERRKAERSAAQELEAKEEQGEELEKTYTSLQAEVRKTKSTFFVVTPPL